MYRNVQYLDCILVIKILLSIYFVNLKIIGFKMLIVINGN